MTRSVLVTGASGFLGAWACGRLAREGWRVAAFDRLDDRRRIRALWGEDVAGAIAWTAGDIGDGAAVRAAVAAAGPEAILHLAAILIPACHADPAEGLRVNLLGHVHVLEAARGAGARVVYASSAAAIARSPSGAIKTFYGVTKHAGEEFARTYADAFGVASLGLRPAIVYGPLRESGETAWVTQAIAAAVAGRPYRIAARMRHRFEYVGEVADILVRAAAASWQGAIASDLTTEEATAADVAAAIRAAVPGASIEMAPGDQPLRGAPADNGPLLAAIGPWTRVPLAEGVRRTAEDMRRLALA
jgi:nucleoside-diphosphate-sugar epimerase